MAEESIVKRTNHAIGLNLPVNGQQRRKHDAYFTPRWCTDALLESGILDLRGKRILEPCAGDGAIVDVLREGGLDVTGRDLNDWGRGWGGHNFLDGMTGFDAVVSNPPFNMMDSFLDRATAAAPVVAVLGRTLLVEGKRRRTALWSQRPPSHILQLPHRVDFTDGSLSGKGGAFVLAWFIWDGSGRPTQFVWGSE
jgi:hypothetical protein